MSTELSVAELVYVLTQLSYYIYLAPSWTKQKPGATESADEALDAETSSAPSIVNSQVNRLRSAAAVVLPVGKGLVEAIETFAASWKLMLDLPLRSEMMQPGSWTDPVLATYSKAQEKAELKRKIKAKRNVPPPKPVVVAPPAPIPKKGHSHPEPPAAHAKKEPVAPPPAPPAPTPAMLLIRSVTGKLADPLPPATGIQEIPPLRVEAPLAVRPRTTPVEDVKRKKPVAKK